MINNVTALAKTAKAYEVPTILTTISAKRGGEIFRQVQAVFPDQKPIDRTFINSWEDRPRRRGREEHRPQEARHRGTLVGDVSGAARHPRDG